jgi:hypothetical protein
MLEADLPPGFSTVSLGMTLVLKRPSGHPWYLFSDPFLLIYSGTYSKELENGSEIPQSLLARACKR